MSGAVSGPAYAADPPAQRIAVPLDALVAMHHRPSGTTHLLAAPAPELLDALAKGPADAAALHARLALSYAVDGGIEAIAARMAELVAAGLAWEA